MASKEVKIIIDGLQNMIDQLQSDCLRNGNTPYYEPITPESNQRPRKETMAGRQSLLSSLDDPFLAAGSATTAADPSPIASSSNTRFSLMTSTPVSHGKEPFQPFPQCKHSRWDVTLDIRRLITECVDASESVIQRYKPRGTHRTRSPELDMLEEPLREVIEHLENLVVSMRGVHHCTEVCSHWHVRYDRRFFLLLGHLDQYLEMLRFNAPKNSTVDHRTLKHLKQKLAAHALRFEHWGKKIRRYYHVFDIVLGRELVWQVKLDILQVEEAYSFRKRENLVTPQEAILFDKTRHKLETRLKKEEDRLKRELDAYEHNKKPTYY
ncbi:hypothetical protein C8J56DRAFT_932513 [Mycena floridula]|nr:hypothetical protein C8J56DRAFT_932513 [Mycena floridula]